MVEMNSFICGDCMDYLPQFPDKYFDLAIVDPPYGIGEGGGRNHFSRGHLSKGTEYHKFDDKEPPTKEYFIELSRVSKNQIIFGANHFIDRLPNPASSCWIVWDKQNGGSDFADCELAWTSFDTAVRMFSFRWAGMLQGDMKNKEFRIHPTQKPIALYEWILSKYAQRGYRILDTHVGSGSSLIACHKSGFEYVGFELDEYYYKKANKRIETEKSQLTIFDMGIERFA